MNNLAFLSSGANSVTLAVLFFALGWVLCMAWVGYRSKRRERMLRLARWALDEAAKTKKDGARAEEERAGEAREADLLRQIRDEAQTLT